MKVVESTGKKWGETLAMLESMLEHRRQRPTVPSEEMYIELQVDVYRKVQEARDRGDFIVGGYEFNFPEIFYAMDLVFMPTLIWGAGIVNQGLGLSRESLDAAKGLGFALDICSGWRGQIGAMIKGFLPRPDCIVGTVGTCDMCAFVADPCARLYGVPYFQIENMFSCSEASVQHLVRELKALVGWLEELSGHRMDWDKLQESVAISKRMVEMNVGLREFQRAVPSPFRPRSSSQSYWAHWVKAGTPEGLRYYEALYNETKDRVERGIGVIPDERFRLFTLPPIPLIRMRVFDWLMKERQTVVASNVTALWESFEMDPSKPLESLARKYVNVPLVKAIAYRTEEGGFAGQAVNAVKEFKVDGMIFWANPACRPTAAIHRIAKDRIMKETGIPLLHIDHDPVDPDYTNEGALKEKLDEFLELLEAREE